VGEREISLEEVEVGHCGGAREVRWARWKIVWKIVWKNSREIGITARIVAVHAMMMMMLSVVFPSSILAKG